jgi:hypothetical protein
MAFELLTGGVNHGISVSLVNPLQLVGKGVPVDLLLMTSRAQG